MHQVIIIGGGPAGSTLGSYLSMAGIDNLIIESAIHPRPHVGESMVTSSTRVFKEIGFLPVLEREGFIKKFGASWHTFAESSEAAISFGEFPQDGIEQDYTYHVDRSKLDLLMLKHAESLGSKIIQGVRASKILFDGEQASGVRVNVAGQEIDLNARIVVDASGRNTLLGRQLKLKKNDPVFNQYAVHAWFENVHRGQGESEDYIHIYFLPVERGWAWQIPINDEITSMGIVAEREVFKRAEMDYPTYFDTYVRSNPNLARAMQDARRVNDFKVEADYSYSMEKLAGDGYMMIGDAARFVDPIFSSGVSVALYSAKYAAERIRYAFEHNDFSENAFKEYERKLRAGTSIWYEFISLYYKLLPLFTFFIQSRQHRLQVLRLLQGEVFDRSEVPVLDQMRRFIATVENTENHLFKSQLTAIRIDEPVPSQA